MPCTPRRFDPHDATAVSHLGRWSLKRLVLAAGSVPLACFLISGCARLQRAHAPTVGACTATIAVIGAEKACPVAPIRFQISVSGCRRSSGTFDYDFKAVSEIRKVGVSRSGSWTQTNNAWEQTESVPLGCDAEIDDINTHITTCVCRER
jgi:hypothetical protein